MKTFVKTNLWGKKKKRRDKEKKNATAQLGANVRVPGFNA
jgi:hypothetical protein